MAASCCVEDRYGEGVLFEVAKAPIWVQELIRADNRSFDANYIVYQL